MIQRSQNRRVVDWTLDKKRQISRDSVREQSWMLGKVGSVYKSGESLYFNSVLTRIINSVFQYNHDTSTTRSLNMNEYCVKVFPVGIVYTPVCYCCQRLWWIKTLQNMFLFFFNVTWFVRLCLTVTHGCVLCIQFQQETNLISIGWDGLYM